jgi:FkbM family methyltransferase
MINHLTGNSNLNRLIPGEIKDDEFYTFIHDLSRNEKLRTVLEIGSSSGQGSTHAWVTGLRENSDQPSLFCLEISKTRFAELEKYYAGDRFVHCYNASSVSVEQFASEQEVIEFYQTISSNLNTYPLEQVLHWLDQDKAYLTQSGVPENGIQLIKRDHNIDFFDAVLIDGSEFTGYAELREIYGAAWILLDDINTFKNYNAHQVLAKDPNYVLVHRNDAIRHGFSIFKRISTPQNFIFFEYEMKESFLVSKLVKPGMIVLDVGANIGNYSILFSRLVGKEGRVYAFEPTPQTFAQLETRLQTYCCENVQTFQTAVFSDNGVVEFSEFPEEYASWNSIGTPQMPNPENPDEWVAIAHREQVPAITLDSFCAEHQISTIDYLKVDVEGAESDVLQGASQLLAAKAIRFIQFEISQKMLEGMGRSAKATFDLLQAYGYECHEILPEGNIGACVNDSNAFYENYIAVPALPIHFFTIVLNGEPFIRYHIQAFRQLKCLWHWHIIEGVADLKHDSAWSVSWGGRITDDLHHNGRSKDGTSEYLDELQRLYPDQITLYRKPIGEFWDGKLEMVMAPLATLQQDCLLWQVDVDELWTTKQIEVAHRLFVQYPEKTAAYYWCWYFVGQQLVVSTRNCYSQNAQTEWLRTWRFRPGCVWASHSPPRLVEPLSDGQWRDLAGIHPFRQDELESHGLVFQHFAYVTPEQLQFKERYYGYANAMQHWQALQNQTRLPVRLRQYFSWVHDLTMVDRAASRGITPIAQYDAEQDAWTFLSADAVKQSDRQPERPTPLIVVDGVFFQLHKTGIARVWKSLLHQWAESGFSQQIIVLDRAGTAPDIAGIQYYPIAPYPTHDKADAIEADRLMLQQVCDLLGADLFISTYFTIPVSTPSVAMLYDMIPEVMGERAEHPIVRAKREAIAHACDYITISQNTAADLEQFYGELLHQPATVAHCGVDPTFSPASVDQIDAFRRKYGITKPYFVVMSADNPSPYKNNGLFFKAFAQLASKTGFELVCTALSPDLPNEWRNYAAGSTVHLLRLTDAELAVAYAGAIALAYPSKYEGFGMPILEAMACACPVITCANSSIPEVADDAVIYVGETDVDAMVNALCDVQKPGIRQRLISASLERSRAFSWAKMATTVSSVCVLATLTHLNLQATNILLVLDWTQAEATLYADLVKVLTVWIAHPQQNQMTLLIDSTHVPETLDPGWLLGDVVMSLLMEQESDIEEPNLVWVDHLSDIQWQTLATQLRGCISLTEAEAAIAHITRLNIPILKLEDL